MGNEKNEFQKIEEWEDIWKSFWYESEASDAKEIERMGGTSSHF